MRSPFIVALLASYGGICPERQAYSGLGAAGLYCLMDIHSNVPCIGASGAISGVVGCFFLLFPRADFDLRFYLGWWRIKTISAKTTTAVGVWIGEQTLLGIISKAVAFSSVAFWGHVGGFAVGLASAAVFRELVNWILTISRSVVHGSTTPT